MSIIPEIKAFHQKTYFRIDHFNGLGSNGKGSASKELPKAIIIQQAVSDLNQRFAGQS